MSSSDCTSSASSPSSSPLNKSGVTPTPPPPPILGSLLTDEDNNALSDEYPDLDRSDEPADVVDRRSAAPCETMQTEEQNVRADDPARNTRLPDSSDASNSESASLANKKDGAPVAGSSVARGGAVAVMRVLRRVNPKSKKISKSRLVPMRKSQLTPRMALYIPPHLQKQTQHVTLAPKATVSSPAVAMTPQQKHRAKDIYEKLKILAKAYQLKQCNVFSKQFTSADEEIVSSESKRTKQAQKNLPAKLWTAEMESFLRTRNTSHEKFVELGDEDKLRESKLAKTKLRKLLRKARSKPCIFKNPYKILEKAHEQYEKSDAFKKVKGVKTYEERKSRSSSDLGCSTSFEMSRDVDDHLEPEFDSSFFLSLSQRHEARMEWSEAILEFNSSPANRLRSPPEIVKVEIIDSDEDSIQNESTTRVKSSFAPEKNLKRYGKFDPIGRLQNPSTPRSSKQSANSSTAPGSLDVSNNEYLNQQFLRRQHDYEREQKYHQIELASESNEFLRGTSENLFRGRDTMDDHHRLFPPVSPFPTMFGTSVNANALRCPPVFPIRNMFSTVRLLSEREPEEPFVGERRRRPHPALVGPVLLQTDVHPSVKEHLVDMRGRNHAKVRRVRSSSPGSCHPSREVNGSHASAGGRNLTLFRSAGENSPIVRNLSNERTTSREYPSSRPLSPFSERIMRAAENDSRRTNQDGRGRDGENFSRQLSPFSERIQNRESSARRLSPFSERMRSRENIDRRKSPGRESNVKSEIVQCPLHKSTPHLGGRELYSDRRGDHQNKLSSWHVRPPDGHRPLSDGALGERDVTHARGSGSVRHEVVRNRYRRDIELTNHVSQCPRFAVQTNPANGSKKSSSRRRESESDSRIMSGNLSKRNHEAGNTIDSRKHSEVRKRMRDESTSRAHPFLGKRQKR